MRQLNWLNRNYIQSLSSNDLRVHTSVGLSLVSVAWSSQNLCLANWSYNTMEHRYTVPDPIQKKRPMDDDEPISTSTVTFQTGTLCMMRNLQTIWVSIWVSYIAEIYNTAVTLIEILVHELNFALSEIYVHLWNLRQVWWTWMKATGGGRLGGSASLETKFAKRNDEAYNYLRSSSIRRSTYILRSENIRDFFFRHGTWHWWQATFTRPRLDLDLFTFLCSHLGII